MTAGIARALVLTTALTIIGMLFAGVAGAATLERQINTRAGDLAIDRSDIYWSRDHTVGRGKYETIVYRGSFLNKSKVEVARFGRTTWESMAGLSAGGGYVVVSIETEFFFGSDSKSSAPTTRVIRFARDGSHREVIATGRVDTGGEPANIVKNGVGYLNDCGTRVKALSVSTTGSVVIGQVTSDRNSRRCGGKKNVDHWRYYEQRLDGSQREIFATDRVVKLRYKRQKNGDSWSDTSDNVPLESVDLIGDRALLLSATSLRYFVRDLSTGALSAPYDFSSKPRANLTTASLAPNGSLALNGFFAGRKAGVTVRSGIFPMGVPGSLKEVTGETQLEFCGSHLISSPIDSRKILELDPVTFVPLRTVGTRPRLLMFLLGHELGCNDDYVYGLKVKERPDGEDISVSLLAHPLN